MSTRSGKKNEDYRDDRFQLADWLAQSEGNGHVVHGGEVAEKRSVVLGVEPVPGRAAGAVVAHNPRQTQHVFLADTLDRNPITRVQTELLAVVRVAPAGLSVVHLGDREEVEKKYVVFGYVVVVVFDQLAKTKIESDLSMCHPTTYI